MRSEIMIKLNQNPDLKLFLREYPSWYRILNRDPTRYKDFVSDYKVKKRKRLIDKIDDLSLMITLAKELM